MTKLPPEIIQSRNELGVILSKSRLNVFPFRSVLLHSIPHPATEPHPARRSEAKPPSPFLFVSVGGGGPDPSGSPNPRREAAAEAEMVYFELLVGAELDGLTNLQPSRGCDDPNFPYYLKVGIPLLFSPWLDRVRFPSLSIANRSDWGLLACFCVLDRSSSARIAGRSPPSPPTSLSASKLTCRKDTAPPISSRRYPRKHHLTPIGYSVVMFVWSMILACECADGVNCIVSMPVRC